MLAKQTPLMKSGNLFLLAASLAGSFFAVHTSSASNTGTDNAGNAAYGDGWQSGDNGGTGFLAWSLTSTASNAANSFAGQFIGDSQVLNNANGTNNGANINTGGNSFGVYANRATGSGSTAFSDAFRDFAGGALAIGQTFSLDLAVNFRNGSKGINVQNVANNVTTNLFTFNVTNDDYLVADATTGNGSIGNTFDVNTAFRISLTQTSAAGGTWTIVRSGGVTDTDTGTYTGNPTTLHLFVNNTDQGANGENNLYANNLAIVPEPGTWATMLLGVGGMAAVVLRRRSVVS